MWSAQCAFLGLPIQQLIRQEKRGAEGKWALRKLLYITVYGSLPLHGHGFVSIKAQGEQRFCHLKALSPMVTCCSRESASFMCRELDLSFSIS